MNHVVSCRSKAKVFSKGIFQGTSPQLRVIKFFSGLLLYLIRLIRNVGKISRIYLFISYQIFQESFLQEKIWATVRGGIVRGGNCHVAYRKINILLALLHKVMHFYQVNPSIHLLLQSRGVDVNKRTATKHSYSLIQGMRFGHYMDSCLFSFSFIGHILAEIKICPF